MNRRLPRRLLARCFFGALLFWTTAAPAADFDFYVLALSWSPTWCAAKDPDGRTAQCNGRQHYGLIVHGLWPQRERGWPENCPSTEPDRVPSSLLRGYYDLIPSAGLAGHEWRKHGTCSGLTQARYFGLIRAAFSKLRLPPVIFNGSINRNLRTGDIENLMISFNPGLPRDGIRVQCDDGRLTDIRICMSKSLEYRSCGAMEDRGCQGRVLTLPAISKDSKE